MTRKSQHEETRNVEPPPTHGGFSHPDQHSFMLQCVLDMKSSVGKLEGAVNNLNDTVKDQGNKLDALRMKFAYVAGGTIIAIAIFGYFLDKVWDVAKPLVDKEVISITAPVTYNHLQAPVIVPAPVEQPGKSPVSTAKKP